MSTAAYALVAELRNRGAYIQPEGDTLNIDAPEGLITDSIREQLRTQKEDVLTVLRRQREIKAYCYQMFKVFQARGLNPSTDTPEREAADLVLEAAMDDYIIGAGSMKEVEDAFQSLLVTLEEIDYEAEVV